MDEMHIKEDLVYDKHTGELVGFTNLGEINSHLLKLQQSQDTSITPLANSLLVVMVRGLFSSLQFPYAQFPCTKLSGDLMYDIFWEAVERLERYYTIINSYIIIMHASLYDFRIDVKVLGVSCDGSSVNRKFFKLHAKKGDEITHKVPNPFAPEERDLYFISDPPHLIKTVRNCWASSKRLMWVSACNIYTEGS